ncbi:hypothetical protein [Larkinella terrae]|uniref:Uncharacterized protein n=1 Tax=Larkinella terrae TaxID=2025311 RepID=A0A7K0EDA1_9BACT|nr:hypothetical protein [Larkinella terrae]MRS59853.1 hypothetical protein [Larkinella terrae]
MDSIGYLLTKAFYAEWKENEAMQVGCKSHHSSLYTWLCELRNIVKVEILDLPREYTMKMAFIGSPSTLDKCIEDLAEWGIIEIVFRGRNQWSGPTKVKIACSFMNKHCTSTVPAVNQHRTRTERALNTIKSNKTGKKKKIDKEGIIDKVLFRENVLLLQTEFDTLVEKHGQAFASDCLDKLSSYKLASGKNYESDYGAINQWVIKAVKKDNTDVLSRPLLNGLAVAPNPTVNRLQR